MGIDKEPSTAIERDDRRWLIGIVITLSFGIFGVVMALLSYSHTTESSAPPAAKPPVSGSAPRRPAAEPVQRERSKGDRSSVRNKGDRDP